MPLDGRDYLEVATTAALEAGAYLLRKFGHVQKVEFKGATNMVTEADRGAEEIICETIHAAFPRHHILAEERGVENGKAWAGSTESPGGVGTDNGVPLWVVDPLDGTTNFVHGFPHFAVSIAVEDSFKVLAGVVYAPVLQELFTAEWGRGASLNGERIRVSGRASLQEALLATGFPYEAKPGAWNVDHVANFVPLIRDLRRFGAASLDLANVACGRLDGYWESKVQAWDISAGSLLVVEAGGTVSDFRGGPFSSRKGQILASNGLIHEAMVQVLSTGTTGL